MRVSYYPRSFTCSKLIVIPFTVRVKIQGDINKSGVRDKLVSVKSTDYHEAPPRLPRRGTPVCTYLFVTIAIVKRAPSGQGCHIYPD